MPWVYQKAGVYVDPRNRTCQWKKPSRAGRWFSTRVLMPCALIRPKPIEPLQVSNNFIRIDSVGELVRAILDYILHRNRRPPVTTFAPMRVLIKQVMLWLELQK